MSPVCKVPGREGGAGEPKKLLPKSDVPEMTEREVGRLAGDLDGGVEI